MSSNPNTPDSGNQAPGGQHPNDAYPPNPYPNPQYQHPYNPYQGVMQPMQQECGTATTSLVFGILAYFILPVIGALIAIVCGHVGLAQIEESNGALRGKGSAIAGLILGYIQIGVVVLITVLILVRASSGSNIINGTYY